MQWLNGREFEVECARILSWGGENVGGESTRQSGHILNVRLSVSISTINSQPLYLNHLFIAYIVDKAKYKININAESMISTHRFHPLYLYQYIPVLSPQTLTVSP